MNHSDILLLCFSVVIILIKVCEACMTDEEQRLYYPVCGLDGNNYWNICKATAAGVKVGFWGKCELYEDPSYCPEWTLMCTKSGRLFSSECASTRLGWLLMEELHPCNVAPGRDTENQRFETLTNLAEFSQSACGCGLEFDPICGLDSKTYLNICHANCAGTSSLSRGECNYVWLEEEMPSNNNGLNFAIQFGQSILEP